MGGGVTFATLLCVILFVCACVSVGGGSVNLLATTLGEPNLADGFCVESNPGQSHLEKQLKLIVYSINKLTVACGGGEGMCHLIRKWSLP